MVHQTVWSNHNHWSKTDKLNFITRFISNYCLAKDVFFITCQFYVAPNSCFCWNCNMYKLHARRNFLLNFWQHCIYKLTFSTSLKKQLDLGTAWPISSLYASFTQNHEIWNHFCSRHFGTYLFVNVSFCSLNNDDNLFSPR